MALEKVVVFMLAFGECFGYGRLIHLLPGASERARFPDGLISGDDDQAPDQCLEVLPRGLKEANRLLLRLVYDKVLVNGTAEVMSPAE